MHHEPTLFCSLAGGPTGKPSCRNNRGLYAGGYARRALAQVAADTAPTLLSVGGPKRATQIFSGGSIGKRSLPFLRPAKNLMPTLITGDFESANSASGSL